MKKNFFFTLLTIFVITSASSQTLFTYGGTPVDAKVFLKAYAKNNTQVNTNKAIAIRDYLDLYIKSRLKIKEAYARKMDTLPQIATEVASLRSQIAETYMSDPEWMTKMEKEAFARSQKDIDVAHIFISYKNANGVVDSVAAQKKRDEVLQQLKNGTDFGMVAQNYSDDPTAKINKGQIGYITVFTLPYEFESIIYDLPTGKYSTPYASRIGYHIFKKLNERKSLGKIKLQQIMLAIPPGSDEKTIKDLEKKADSLYKRLQAGDDFATLATGFSNDYISAATGGNIPDISVGQYDPAFETVIWSLPKDGAISKPFQTTHGWHIVKRLEIKPVVTDPNDKINQLDLQNKIKADPRFKSADGFIYTMVKKKGIFKANPINKAALWEMADSAYLRKPLTAVGRTLRSNTPLFTLGGKTTTVGDWITYGMSARFKLDGSGVKPYDEVYEEFEKTAVKKYYQEHLEDFSADFRDQMTEFKDGNLFFEIMQEEVWTKAQNDSAAIATLYKQQPQQYKWKQSADAVIFYCSDQATAKQLYDEVKKNPAQWKTIAGNNTEKIVTDSTRYEWSQLPSLEKSIPVAGMLTTPLLNTTDNSATFAYIIHVYPEATPRNFNEAKGMVINDYQELLEKKWNEKLQKKYPVKIYQQVLTSISK